MRKKILIFSDYYLPGYKAGGPVKSVSSIVEKLGDEFAFFVVTSDKDLGTSERYPGVICGNWVTVGKAEVLYVNSGFPVMEGLIATLKQDWSCVYLNGFFSINTIKLLLALKLLRIRVPVLLAPRGEFSPGALKLKGKKKSLYIALAKVLRLYDQVYWHASTEREQSEISLHFPLRPSGPLAPGRVFVAGNLSTYQPAVYNQLLDKQVGTLRVVFLSRISRKKNLLYALDILTKVHGQITFDIWGPLEDEGYWQECKAIVARAQTSLRVEHKGSLESKEVVTKLGEYHLFLFPTLGENFGHVILEAMTAGCALLLSDTTPWRDLREKGYGWDIPLTQPEDFVAALSEAVSWDSEKFEQVSAAARASAIAYLERSESVSANLSMLQTICESNKICE